MSRELTCCFTGHRPEKLPWGINEGDSRCVLLKKKLYDAVEAAYGEGIRHFICGMARGCDFYFAEAVLALRREYPDITLEAAIPCAGQSASWSLEHRTRWSALVEQCDKKTVLQEYFTMVMLVDTAACTESIGDMADILHQAGEEQGLSIRIQREDIFNAMHRI